MLSLTQLARLNADPSKLKAIRSWPTAVAKRWLAASGCDACLEALEKEARRSKVKLDGRQLLSLTEATW